MDGSKALIARLDNLGSIDKPIRQIVKRNADFIKSRTQSNAPVDTGKLRDGVSVSMSGNAYQSKAVISANAYTKKKFNYGLFQEQYHRRGKSKFMERAFNSVEGKFKREIQEAMLKK